MHEPHAPQARLFLVMGRSGVHTNQVSGLEAPNGPGDGCVHAVVAACAASIYCALVMKAMLQSGRFQGGLGPPVKL